jgi:hypothetical protein
MFRKCPDPDPDTDPDPDPNPDPDLDNSHVIDRFGNPGMDFFTLCHLSYLFGVLFPFLLLLFVLLFVFLKGGLGLGRRGLIIVLGPEKVRYKVSRYPLESYLETESKFCIYHNFRIIFEFIFYTQKR